MLANFRPYHRYEFTLYTQRFRHFDFEPFKSRAIQFDSLKVPLTNLISVHTPRLSNIRKIQNSYIVRLCHVKHRIEMTDPTTTIAHLAKFVTSLICLKYFDEPYSILVIKNQWATRAFQILLIHSIIGIFRFGNPSTSKHLRGFYTIFSKISNTVPFGLIVTEILHWNKTSEQITLTLLILTIFPIVYESRSKERTRRHLTDVSVGLNICALIYVSIMNENYSAISLVVSYIFTHFFLEDVSDKYDVPHRDLIQYSLCFMEVFSVLTLRDLQGTV